MKVPQYQQTTTSTLKLDIIYKPFHNYIQSQKKTNNEKKRVESQVHHPLKKKEARSSIIAAKITINFHFESFLHLCVFFFATTTIADAAHLHPKCGFFS